MNVINKSYLWKFFLDDASQEEFAHVITFQQWGLEENEMNVMK